MFLPCKLLSLCQATYFELGTNISLLKKGLITYPAHISFTVTGKCVPLRTSLWIIVNILSVSASFSKNFCTSLSILIRISNSCGSWNYDLSDLWYISEITPSWNDEFSSKSILISWSKSDKFLGTYCKGISVDLRGDLQVGSRYIGIALFYILYGFSFDHSGTWIITRSCFRNCVIWYWNNSILNSRTFWYWNCWGYFCCSNSLSNSLEWVC